MKFTMPNFFGSMRRDFDYCETSFDDGVKYSVYYGGKQPLSCRQGEESGTDIGDVARFNHEPKRWFACADTGRASDIMWVGGFSSRVEASIYLFGRKMERDNPRKYYP